MNRKLLHIAISAAAAIVTAMPAAAQSENKAPQWEQVRTTENSDPREDLQTHEAVDIHSRDGMLYISVAKPVRIEIYSILGQLITSRQLKPGTVRLNLNRRGVYILKAGSITRRINL